MKQLAKALNGKTPGNSIFLEGLLASSAPLVFSSLALDSWGQALDPASGQAACPHDPFLFIMQDAEEAGYFYHDLCQVMGEHDVLFFPSSYRRAIKYGQKDPANEVLRTEVLSRLSSQFTVHSSQLTADDKRAQPNRELCTMNRELYIVSYPEALAEMVVTRKQLDSRMLSLEKDQTVNVDDICQTLRDFGFLEVDYVYEPGQFALRGSILDVFSFSHEYPYRVDFFGDDIDSIRTFEVENQLSRERCQRIDIVPDLTTVEEKESFFRFLPAQTVLVMKSYGFVRDMVERTYQEGFSTQAMQERSEGATEMEQYQIRCEMQRDSNIITGAQFVTDSEPFRRIELKAGAGRQSLETSPTTVLQSLEASPTTVRQSLEASPTRGQSLEASPTIRFNVSAQPLFHKNFDMLTQTFEDYLLKGYRLCILADSQKQIERLKDILSEKLKVKSEKCSNDSVAFSASDTNHTFNLPLVTCNTLFEGITRTLHEGFVDHDLRLCCFTDHQIFDRFHKYNLKSDKARSGKVALTLKEIQQFEIGDYVVHVDHGVGRFAGLVRIPNGNTTQEVIKLVYQNEDVVFVSIHSLHKISKYKGKEGEPPHLGKLGSGAWEKLKERTKKKIKDIARDLIRLYAARREEKGFQYSPDSFLQRELEASFRYEDTPDQSKATAEVKADMESDRPMDRLVCGDVGFGKTEVAIRAAFKAATDGKQVAVLVPTTVLAYQHYQTFKERLKDMPVRVEYLSRARTSKQQRKVLKGLESGDVNILIGTHRLLGKDVKFKDLGLLVIDEEQKFGVSTKEKLRQLRVNVDTLTISATPIPRTLQFSLMGARDLSIIQTPPPNRYPIQTEVHTFNDQVIADAINFEMSRNGQVFFVNNRISRLPELKLIIEREVPDCRVAIGHGQMDPEELEKIILGFINYDYDVLLSTTIVENGIDIPNANTIIVNDAQNFGLSDLHQMRGRVGRGNRKAFCYLLAPPLSVLTPEARRRLQAIENFSDLGSGIHIAMQDLDIRGAGNLLGAEQSGFIADLGYETYQKVLSEAVHELRRDEFGELFAAEEQEAAAQGREEAVYVEECQVESDLELLLPQEYVTGSAERMLLYRELDGLQDDGQVAAFKARLIDRFGPIPKETEELLGIVPLRRMAARLGVEKVMLKGGQMALYLVSNAQSPYYQSSTFGKLIAYMMRYTRRCDLREKNGKCSMVVKLVASVSEALAVFTEMLEMKAE